MNEVTSGCVKQTQYDAPVQREEPSRCPKKRQRFRKATVSSPTGIQSFNVGSAESRKEEVLVRGIRKLSLGKSMKARDKKRLTLAVLNLREELLSLGLDLESVRVAQMDE